MVSARLCPVVFLLCLGQRFYRFVKPPSRMRPASGDLQVFPLIFDRVVNLVPIRNTYPFEILQEFPGMAGIACLLVLIQDDLPVCIHPPRPVNPQITFASSGAAVLIYQHRGLVCLKDMVSIQFFTQIVIKDCQIPVCALYRPVRHVLPGDMQAKLLFLPVQRNGIYVFCVHYSRF